MPTPNDKQLYLDATQEVDSGTQDPALWAKAMALDKGDKGKARYRYIELRVEELTQSPPSAPPEDPASSIDSGEEVARSQPDNSASQTPDQDTKFDPAGNKTSAAPSSLPAIKYDKRIPEGWAPLTGDEAYVNDRLERIRIGTAVGIIVDGIWYVPAAQSLLSKSRSTPIIQTKQWSVFTHPIYGQKVAPHTERKNWAACFFFPIWHLATNTRHGLGLLMAWLVYWAMSCVIYAFISDNDMLMLALFLGLAIDITFSFAYLFKANTFRQKSLEARGYKLVDIIEARTKDEVLAKLKSAS